MKKNSIQQIQVIINPASGKDAPILNTLNRVFRKYNIKWQAAVTHKPGDAVRLTKEAVANGVDLIAGYGGDGTLMEITNELAGSDIPLAILPGGTGNGIAKELEIPIKLEEAVEIICREPKFREIDLGFIDGQYFLLHAYVGLKSTQRASRELKDRFGILAYVAAILQVIAEPQLSHYSLTLDGQKIERDGIVCMVTNAAGLGINLPITKDINLQNGLLNLFVVKETDLSAFMKLPQKNDYANLIESWQGRDITLKSDPPQTVWVDGEEAKQTPCTIKIVPKSLKVLVA